jgi:hypothetical protein
LGDAGEGGVAALRSLVCHHVELHQAGVFSLLLKTYFMPSLLRVLKITKKRQ